MLTNIKKDIRNNRGNNNEVNFLIALLFLILNSVLNIIIIIPLTKIAHILSLITNNGVSV